MKLRTLFLISTLFVSCGDDLPRDGFGSSINSLRSLEAEAVISDTEKLLLADFCTAIEDKLRFYNSSLADQTSRSVTISNGTSECGEDITLEENNFSVRSVGTSLFYRDNTVFPEVLDHNSSEVRDLCSGVNSPIDVSRGSARGTRAQWITLLDNSDSDCREDALDNRTVCMRIESGTLENSNNESYRIDKVELLRTTRADTEFRGVIYARKSQSNDRCESGDVSEKVQNITAFP